MQWNRLFVLSLALSLGACTQKAAPKTSNTTKAPSTKDASSKTASKTPPKTPSKATPKVVKAGVTDSAKPDKSSDKSSDKSLSAVDWQAAGRFAKLDAAMVPESLSKALAPLKVPVLLPATPKLLASAKLKHGQTWYAVSMEDQSHGLYVQGAQTSSEGGDLKLGQEKPSASKPLITRSGQVVTLSFERFGAGYGIDIECKDPKDVRCTKDDYANQLMSILGIAGGKSSAE